MNKKGFAISIILYSLVFVLITILYMILSITKNRYVVTSKLRESVVESMSTGLYDRIMRLCDDSSISYVGKYQISNGAPIDTPDGTGNEQVCYYTSTDSNNYAGQNGNVIFGDYCWQIVRTTADGGVKLLYNGPKTNDNKCPNSNSSRPSSVGAQASEIKEVSLSGSKIYGDSFEIYKDGNTNKFRLLHTDSYTWSSSTYQDLIGKYVCGTSSSPTGTATTCTVLYYVGEYVSSTQAYATKYTIGTNEHFSLIGTTGYAISNDSLAYGGYMFNTAYPTKSFSTYGSVYLLPLFNFSSSMSYYFGSSAVWNSSTNKYDLKVDSGNGNLITPTETTTLSSYGTNYRGLYTCKSATDTSCSTVYYIVAKYNSYNIHVVPLSSGQAVTDVSQTWTYGTSYTKNSSNSYTINNVTTKTFLLKDWYTDYLQYRDIYVCADLTSTTCSEIYYIGTTQNYRFLYNSSNNEYIYGNSVTYSNGNYTINNNSDPTKYHSIWEWYKDGVYSIKSSHYTCLTKDENNCGDTVYFVLNLYNDVNVQYIELKNGEKIDDALNRMINYSNSNSSVVNKYSSPIKSLIESWYEANLLKYSDYIEQNAVFCNNRKPISAGGWSINNSTGNLIFNRILTDVNTSLGCDNVTDRFSQNNNIAKLKYPVGLLSENEINYMKTNYAKTGMNYWLMSPREYVGYDMWNYFLNTSGNITGGTNTNSFSVRPVIVLKSGITVKTGNGTYDKPYIIDATSNSE